MIKDINGLYDVEIDVDGEADGKWMTIRDALMAIGVEVADSGEAEDMLDQYLQVAELREMVDGAAPHYRKGIAIAEAVTEFLRGWGNGEFHDSMYDGEEDEEDGEEGEDSFTICFDEEGYPDWNALKKK